MSECRHRYVVQSQLESNGSNRNVLCKCTRNIYTRMKYPQRPYTALRLYKHTTEAEHQVVSEVLAAKGGTAFHQVQKELANKEDLQLWSHSLQITHNHYISHHLCLQVLLLLTVILALVKVAS